MTASANVTLRSGRQDLLDRIDALEADNAALITEVVRLTNEHETMLETLTRAQSRCTSLLNEDRGFRRVYLNDTWWAASFRSILGAAWSAECKHGKFFPRLLNIADGTSGSLVDFRDSIQAIVSRAEEGDGELTWAGLLLEEVSETAAETDPRALREELAQVGAVVCAWIHAIDAREKT